MFEQSRNLKLFGLMASIVLSCAAHAAEKTEASVSFSKRELATAAWIRDHASKENQSYRILESLTTEVGSRMAGTPGDARAVAWAEAKFKELGFDKVWKEAVRFPSWQRGVESAEILAPFSQKLAVTALGNSISTPEAGIEAEIIRFATLNELIAAPVESVRGKIVFIDHKMKSANDYGQVRQGRASGAVEAARKGALAIIIRSVGTDSHRLPHTGGMHYAADVMQIPAAAMSNVDADLVARILMRGGPVKMALKLGSHAGEVMQSYNVIGEITGSELPNEYVLIGGHLDSWDLGTGAIDDGAGCAITMAAAEFLHRHGLRPRRSVRVILYANEEQGLFGGSAYASEHQAQLKQIQAAAEADSGQGPVLQLDSFVGAKARKLVMQMQSVLAPLGVKKGTSDADPGPDMGVLKSAGVPSFELVLKSDDYFDIHHTADDTFDKIEPARITQAAAAFAVFAYLAAQAPIYFGEQMPVVQKSH